MRGVHTTPLSALRAPMPVLPRWGALWARARVRGGGSGSAGAGGSSSVAQRTTLASTLGMPSAYFGVAAMRR